jgi:adenosylmethionine-8-amino-7-oxononanoate aminotransferase
MSGENTNADVNVNVNANASERARALREEIVRLDKQHVWHPYTPMDAYVAGVDPLVVHRAKGAWLEDVDGTRYLDGNSSWYSQSLGHGHPRLVRALTEQAATLAHCSLAGTTHEPAARLAAELCAIAPRGLTRVFYTDNGSSSIELAVKMCVQAWGPRARNGAEANRKKTRFVALDGAFHGDTIGATSLGGVDVFRRPFADIVFDCVRVPSPAEGGHARAFDAMRRVLREGKDTIAAVVVEPIVQAAGGMLIYDAAYLRELRAECDACDVLLVFDEVFTGYARTGPMWASAHAGVSPDILCLGKAFAALLPMGAVLATEDVFDAFRGGKENALYYGHTFCGNPLGAALAREVLAIHRDERISERVAVMAPRIAAAFARIAELPGVERVRSIGMIGAADLADAGAAPGYFAGIGWRVYDEARKRGAYLRPLGDTIYVCPPLTIDDADLDRLLGIVEESARAVLARKP